MTDPDACGRPQVIERAGAELGRDGSLEVAQFSGIGRLFSALGTTVG